MEDALEEEMATHFSVFATEQAHYLPQLYLLFFSLSLSLSLSLPLYSFFPNLATVKADCARHFSLFFFFVPPTS